MKYLNPCRRQISLCFVFTYKTCSSSFSPLEGIIKPVISWGPEQQDDTWLSCQSADEQKLFISVLGRSTLESVSCTKAVTYLCQNRRGSHRLFYKSFVSKPLKDTSKAFFLLFQPLADEARGYTSAGQWWIDVNNITNTRYLDNQLV